MISLFKNAIGSFKNQIDSIDPATRHQRRRTRVETKDEINENFPSEWDRHEVIGQQRDLYRNHTTAKTIIKQLRWMVVGTGQKLIMMTPDQEWNEAVEFYVNEVWMRQCDSVHNRHLRDLNGIALITVELTGDCLMSEEDGKLRFYDSDQIEPLNDGDFKKWKASEGVPNAIQERGTVVDGESGEIMGWFVTSKFGKSTLNLEEATFLNANSATILMDPWRFNMKRGESDFMTAYTVMKDIKEFRTAEVMKAKIQAGAAMAVYSEDSIDMAQARTNQNLDRSEDAHVEEEDGALQKRYRNYEKMSQGMMEYLMPGDKIELLETNSPPANYPEFYNHNVDSAGASVGLSPTSTRLTTNTSFSAAKVEMIKDGMATGVYQAWLVDYVLNWQIPRAILHGMRTGEIPRKKESEWMLRWKYEHPERGDIDELKKRKANTEGLQTLQLDYEDLHGPRWKEKFTKAAEQINFAKSLGLNPLKEKEEVDVNPGTNERPESDDEDNS